MHIFYEYIWKSVYWIWHPWEGYVNIPLTEIKAKKNKQ